MEANGRETSTSCRSVSPDERQRRKKDRVNSRSGRKEEEEEEEEEEKEEEEKALCRLKIRFVSFGFTQLSSSAKCVKRWERKMCMWGKEKDKNSQHWPSHSHSHNWLCARTDSFRTRSAHSDKLPQYHLDGTFALLSGRLVLLCQRCTTVCTAGLNVVYFLKSRSRLVSRPTIFLQTTTAGYPVPQCKTPHISHHDSRRSF